MARFPAERCVRPVYMRRSTRLYVHAVMSEGAHNEAIRNAQAVLGSRYVL